MKVLRMNGRARMKDKSDIQNSGVTCAFFLSLFIGCLIFSSCSKKDAEKQPTRDSTPFFVLVQNNPYLSSGAAVVSKGVQIGEVTEKDLTPNNVVRLQIGVEKKYAPLIREGVVFYSGEGQLNYVDLSEGEGTPLPETSDILGFASEAEFRQWRTVEWVQETYDLIMRYLNDLYQEYDDSQPGANRVDPGNQETDNHLEATQGKRI